MNINLFLNKKLIKDKDIFDGIMDYYKRCSRFTSINLFYQNNDLFLNQDSYNINVTSKGRYINSIYFSNLIKDKSMNRIKNVNVVFNVSNNIKFDNICFVNFDICEEFSYIVFLEQIYRAYKIINNEPYHK